MKSDSKNNFRSDFVWGCATAAFQIEGAANADGKGPSVWDMMCRIPGKVKGGDNGDVACNHYTRVAEDIEILKQIGVAAYRFSVSWPRVLPEGTGKVNQPGLDFYDRLVDKLLDAGITPYCTLFHWDFPYALFLRGGWLNPDSVSWFAEYASLLGERLGDRMKHWMTHNEPQCFLGMGHRTGVHAPGLILDWPEVLLATHHALWAHGRAVSALRSTVGKDSVVGLALVGNGGLPIDNTEAAINAVRSYMFTPERRDFWNLAWYLDPIVKGAYPADAVAYHGSAAPVVTDEAMREISAPIDYIGLNIYNSELIAPANDGKWQLVNPPIGQPLTKFNCPVTPEAMYWSPKLIHERYGLPIVIAENGCSCHDWIATDGKVHDPARVDFLTRYLSYLKRAACDGVDIRGFFQWSLMDNFEWSEGYRERFGLVHVDYATGKRTLKDSAYWYRDVAKSNGTSIPIGELSL